MSLRIEPVKRPAPHSSDVVLLGEWQVHNDDARWNIVDANRKTGSPDQSLHRHANTAIRRSDYEGTAAVQGSLGSLDALRKMAERYLPPDAIAGFMQGPEAKVKDRMRVVVHPRSWTIWNMKASAQIAIRPASYEEESP